jgi:hypothetical protein
VFVIRNRNYNLQKYGYSSYVNTCKSFGSKIREVGKNQILRKRIKINNSSQEYYMLLTFNNTGCRSTAHCKFCVYLIITDVKNLHCWQHCFQRPSRFDALCRHFQFTPTHRSFPPCKAFSFEPGYCYRLVRFRF